MDSLFDSYEQDFTQLIEGISKKLDVGSKDEPIGASPISGKLHMSLTVVPRSAQSDSQTRRDGVGRGG